MPSKAKPKTRALTVRKLPADHYEWLREQAAAHGRSMEAEMRAMVARAKLGLAERPFDIQTQPDAKLRGFAEPPARKGGARRGGAEPKPVPKLSADEAVAKLQLLFAKATKNRKSKKLLSEEFMEERRRMWGEE
jgi:plasmid stability protein